jgi:bacterioferritin
MDKNKTVPAAADNREIIALLNRVLKLEYTIIIHLPRISGAFHDREIRDKVLHLSSASVKHADDVAAAVEKLGGKAEWEFEPFPDDGNLVRMFETQVMKEEDAHNLHLECARLAPGVVMKELFRKMAKDGVWHKDVALEILAYLKANNAPAN